MEIYGLFRREVFRAIVGISGLVFRCEEIEGRDAALDEAY